MKKVILITGISTGFGRETARILAEKGHKVYGTLRSGTGDISGVNYLTMDLTDPGSLRKAVSDIVDAERRIDVLINNGGMHSGGPAETTTEAAIRLQFETNFFGTVHLTQLVLPVMRNNGGGTIINISSIGGLMGLPFQAYYSAVKFAMEGFSEALRMETAAHNVKVVLVNPGDFNTNNTSNRRKYIAPAGPGDPYTDQFQRTLSVIEKDETGGWKPEILAAKLVEVAEMSSPKQRYIIASFEQKLAVALKYVLPGKLFRKILMAHYDIRNS